MTILVLRQSSLSSPSSLSNFSFISFNRAQPERLIFNYISSDVIKQDILNLNKKKASREGDIPVNILKDVTDAYLPILTKIISSSFEQNEFPRNLKLTDVLPIFKKKRLLLKKDFKACELTVKDIKGF